MKRILIFILLLFFTINLFAQTDREFWFAAPEVTWRHDNGRFYPEWGTTYAGGEPILLRVVTNTLPANVTIEQPANSMNFPTINLSIPANSTQTVNLTDLGLQAEVENTYDNATGIMDKGIHIFSDNLITVYYEVRTRNNCDIFARTLHPTPSNTFILELSIWKVAFDSSKFSVNFLRNLIFCKRK